MSATNSNLPLAFIVVALALALHGACSAAWAVDHDKGAISKMGDMKLEVEGALGIHVFEISRDCTWCEVGTDVVIEFLGYGRARIRPASPVNRGRPLIGVVAVDGREGAEKIPEKKKEKE